MALKKLTLVATALTGAMLMPSAGQAQGYYAPAHGYDAPAYGNGYYQPVQYRYRRGDYYRGDRYDRRRYDRRHYDGRRDRRYRGRCRDDGDTGTIVGAIAGGLLGHEVAEGRRGRGDGTLGAIIGGVGGALVGRAVDRDC